MFSLSLNEYSAVSVELWIPLKVLKTFWEQALIRNKGRETRKDFPTKQISQTFLSSCTVALRNRLSLRSILQRKSFSSRRYFKQCKPSILKCLYGIILLRAFKFMQGRFRQPFYQQNIARKLIWEMIPLFYGSFVQHFHNLLID